MRGAQEGGPSTRLTKSKPVPHTHLTTRPELSRENGRPSPGGRHTAGTGHERDTSGTRAGHDRDTSGTRPSPDGRDATEPGHGRAAAGTRPGHGRDALEPGHCRDTTRHDLGQAQWFFQES
eukprot:CAMPEP_0119399034 /NCGR_PEP_ID=MMETSP1334-20130426/141153_1 /TAXON_ID=127549 /ORGANISM="Calcidiscus leptoporus, Strain RCC1130" /LENGTH=120 /DNA_ID=CAMNT_0007422917 /DNA_START=445 /DNA_END=807 /DNA_ORIENTATION=+